VREPERNEQRPNGAKIDDDQHDTDTHALPPPQRARQRCSPDCTTPTAPATHARPMLQHLVIAAHMRADPHEDRRQAHCPRTQDSPMSL